MTAQTRFQLFQLELLGVVRMAGKPPVPRRSRVGSSSAPNFLDTTTRVIPFDAPIQRSSSLQRYISDGLAEAVVFVNDPPYVESKQLPDFSYGNRGITRRSISAQGSNSAGDVFGNRRNSRAQVDSAAMPVATQAENAAFSGFAVQQIGYLPSFKVKEDSSSLSRTAKLRRLAQYVLDTAPRMLRLGRSSALLDLLLNAIPRGAGQVLCTYFVVAGDHALAPALYVVSMLSVRWFRVHQLEGLSNFILCMRLVVCVSLISVSV